jgi:hypothetical protein
MNSFLVERVKQSAKYMRKEDAIMPYAIKSSMSMVLARFWSNLLSTRMAWVLSFRLKFSGITFAQRKIACQEQSPFHE